MKPNRLKCLYIEELRVLCTAENQMVKSLTARASAATTADLRSGIEGHLAQTREHMARLREIFEALGENPNGRTQIPAEFFQEEKS
jgi:ferritin-like metal-binding protein YciE